MPSGPEGVGCASRRQRRAARNGESSITVRTDLAKQRWTLGADRIVELNIAFNGRTSAVSITISDL